jgi:hypothetical protein
MTMTLADVIRRLDELSDELCIYATPRWSPSSRAIAAREPEDGSLPDGARGMTYLTSVRQTRSLVAERKRYRPDRALTADDLCAAVIYFAIYDEPEPLASALSDVIKLPIAI